jgi:hypothetical protein
MTNTQDIIKAALDLMGREVTLHIKGDEAFGGVTVRFGTVDGVSGKGERAHVIVTNYHDSSGHTVPRTLVGVEEIILIKAYHPGA